MNVEMAQELLTYNIWANKRLLDAVAGLDSEQYSRHVGGSYPSVQSTLTHTMWAEWLWLERWQGHSPKDLFSPEDFPAFSDLADRWSQIRAGQQSFVHSLAPADLQKVLRYTNRANEVWEYTLWRMLFHTFNHSTYHRGQVTNMLRVLHTQPAATDFLEWWDEGRSS